MAHESNAYRCVSLSVCVCDLCMKYIVKRRSEDLGGGGLMWDACLNQKSAFKAEGAISKRMKTGMFG